MLNSSSSFGSRHSLRVNSSLLRDVKMARHGLIPLVLHRPAKRGEPVPALPSSLNDNGAWHAWAPYHGTSVKF